MTLDKYILYNTQKLLKENCTRTHIEETIILLKYLYESNFITICSDLKYKGLKNINTNICPKNLNINEYEEWINFTQECNKIRQLVKEIQELKREFQD